MPLLELLELLELELLELLELLDELLELLPDVPGLQVAVRSDSTTQEKPAVHPQMVQSPV